MVCDGDPTPEALIQDTFKGIQSRSDFQSIKVVEEVENLLLVGKLQDDKLLKTLLLHSIELHEDAEVPSNSLLHRSKILFCRLLG